MLHALALCVVAFDPPLRWTYTVDNAIIRFYSDDNVQPTFNTSTSYVDFGAIQQSFTGYITLEEKPLRFLFRLFIRTRNAAASTMLNDGFKYEYGKPKPVFPETRMMDVIYLHELSVPFTEFHYYPSPFIHDRSANILDTQGNFGRPRPIYQPVDAPYFAAYIGGFSGYVRAKNDTDPFWFERN